MQVFVAPQIVDLIKACTVYRLDCPLRTMPSGLDRSRIGLRPLYMNKLIFLPSVLNAIKLLSQRLRGREDENQKKANDR